MDVYPRDGIYFLIFRKKYNFPWMDFPNPCLTCFPCSRNVLLEFYSVIEQRGMHPYEGRGGGGEGEGEEEEEEKEKEEEKEEEEGIPDWVI